MHPCSAAQQRGQLAACQDLPCTLPLLWNSGVSWLPIITLHWSRGGPSVI